MRRLKGLEDTIGLTAVDPLRDGRGWAFREGDQHDIDPVNGFEFLSQAYAATDAQVPRARHRPRLVGHRDGAHRQQHGRRGQWVGLSQHQRRGLTLWFRRYTGRV